MRNLDPTTTIDILYNSTRVGMFFVDLEFWRSCWKLNSSNFSIMCYRISPFKGSNFEAPPHIKAMESQGLQGDTILVEGIKTGSANVKVKLKDKAYKVCVNVIVRVGVVSGKIW